MQNANNGTIDPKKQSTQVSIISQANRELSAQLADPAIMRALVATTFKGFRDEQVVRQACLEAMMRGYSFKDILQKKIYAIPFGAGYSLVQAIADVRAIAMRNGQIGKDAPIYEDDENGKIISCSVTVKRLVQGHIGEYTATVFFSEYDKKKDNWVTKPRTMIAKVAEMHALRMAFPDELSEAYVEEEFEKDAATSNRFGGVILPDPKAPKPEEVKPENTRNGIDAEGEKVTFVQEEKAEDVVTYEATNDAMPCSKCGNGMSNTDVDFCDNAGIPHTCADCRRKAEKTTAEGVIAKRQELKK